MPALRGEHTRLDTFETNSVLPVPLLDGAVGAARSWPAYNEGCEQVVTFYEYLPPTRRTNKWLYGDDT